MKKINRYLSLALCCLCFGALNVHAEPAVSLGMPEGELLTAKGKPSGTMKGSTATIYSWPDMTVTVQGSKVIQIEARNPAKEREDDARRAVLAASEKEKIDLENKRRATVAAQENAKQQRQAQDYADYLRERAAEAAKNKAYINAMKERELKLASLDSEIQSLTQELQRAYANGDDSRVFTLKNELDDLKKERDFVASNRPPIN